MPDDTSPTRRDDFFDYALSVHRFTVAPDGTIRGANQAAAEGLDVPLGELQGRSLFELLTEPDAGRLRHELQTPGRRRDPIRLNFSGAPHEPYTLECWLDVGEAEATIVGEPPLKDEQKLHRRLMQVNQDLAILSRERARAIEQQRRARADAEAANRGKDEAIATVAHELRQPLGSARFALELLRKADPGSPPFARGLAALERQVLQLTRMVDDLLDAARLRQQKLELRVERVELVALLRDLTEGLQSRAAQAGVSLECALADGEVWLRGDAARLTQVFSNLLENALKYTNRGGRITLTAAATGATATIAVTDTGRGIAPQLLPRLFQLFAQQASGERGGLGIGLAVAHAIVTLHGGSIEAKSGGAGQGAEFVVRLPLEEAGAGRGEALGAGVR